MNIKSNEYNYESGKKKKYYLRHEYSFYILITWAENYCGPIWYIENLWNGYCAIYIM